MDIIKYIQSNDDYGLDSYFNDFLDNDKSLNIIDKFFIFLQLRALNFNNRVTITGTHETGREAVAKIDIFKFLGSYISYIEKIEKNYSLVVDELTINFKIPSSLFFRNLYALMADCVTDITISGESIYKEKKDKEKLEILFYP